MGVMDSNWGQTEEDVYIDLNIGGGVKKKDVQIKLNGKDYICQLKDGRKWTGRLLHQVNGSPKITLKDGALRVQFQKKMKFKEWACLEERGENKQEKLMENSDEGKMEENKLTVECNEKSSKHDDSVQTEETMEEETMEEETMEEETMEEETMEEEYMLDHVKHDFFPRLDLKVLYLHVYVKKIQRDSVKVTFKEEEIAIKFKTNDNHFLQLNANSTNETLFCWTMKPWKPIDPSGCSHKVTNSNMEVIITKQKAEKWKALECSTRDSKPGNRARVGSQGDWVPLSATQPTTPSDESSEIAKDAGSEKACSERETPTGAVGGAKSVEIKENLARIKKPTCTVPPLSLGKQSQPPPPVTAPSLYQGFCGLDNLGNTCFMNSVLQVLANTKELKDFMLEADFKNEINRDNPLGTGGHLVLSFAVLIRRLWGGQYKSIAPSKLKSIISSKASQFMGFAQHDAQEFMAFLLDGLHEDINRIHKKPYTQTVDSDGRPDQVVAEEAWKMHRKRNDSFIVDLFQGQYKSKLVCPECNKVSITFDPFMHLSVPLPKKKRYIPIYFFSRDCHCRPVKHVISLSSDDTVHELTVQVAKKAGVNAANLRVFEVYRSRIHKMFSRRGSLSGVSFNDIIFVCEVLSPAMAGENVVEVTVIQRMLMPPPLPCCSHCKRSCEKGRSLKRCTKCYRAAYCDQACQKSNWSDHRLSCRRAPEPVGCPFIISLPQSHATYSRLCRIMENYARYSTNVFQPPMKAPATPTSPTHSSSDNQTPQSSTSTHTPPSTESSQCESSPGAPSEMHPPPGGDSIPDRTCDAPPGENSERGRGGGEGGGRSDASAENGTENVGCADDTVDMVGDSEVGGEGKAAQRGGRDDGGDHAAGNKGAEGSGSHSTEGTADGTTTATVVGQPQTQERKMPLFFIKPVNNIGNSLQNKDRLQDHGDVPLDLGEFAYLAMDWRNDPKQENNVLVESKSLDFIEDESVTAGRHEDKELNLKQCLNIFTEPEKLSPEEAWYCPKCKQHREATKQMLLWKLPSTLIIQLKRFSFGNMLWRDKIDKMVDYPVKGLDLSPFCHSNSGQSLIYDLYGVINHHGGILGGHYTSFGRLVSQSDWSKNEHEWRMFDDSHVTPISEKNVVTRSAYLLFYRRRQAYMPYITRGPAQPEPEEEEDSPEAMDDRSSSSSSEMEVGEGDTNREEKQDQLDKVHLIVESGVKVAPSANPQQADNRYASTPPSPRPEEASVQAPNDDVNDGAEEQDIGYTNMEDID